MNKENIIRKLTSRKLWLAIALFASGLIVTFGGDSSSAETVTGCIMQGGAVLSYILAEGWADAKHTDAPDTLDGIAIEDSDESE